MAAISSCAFTGTTTSASAVVLDAGVGELVALATVLVHHLASRQLAQLLLLPPNAA